MLVEPVALDDGPTFDELEALEVALGTMKPKSCRACGAHYFMFVLHENPSLCHACEYEGQKWNDENDYAPQNDWDNALDEGWADWNWNARQAAR